MLIVLVALVVVVIATGRAPHIAAFVPQKCPCSPQTGGHRLGLVTLLASAVHGSVQGVPLRRDQRGAISVGSEGWMLRLLPLCVRVSFPVEDATRSVRFPRFAPIGCCGDCR